MAIHSRRFLKKLKGAELGKKGIEKGAEVGTKASTWPRTRRRNAATTQKIKNMWGCGFGYSLDLSTIP